MVSSPAAPRHGSCTGTFRPRAPRTGSGRARRVFAVALIAGLSAVARGQSLRDLLEEALDQKVTEIEIRDRPIREALAILEQKTGIRFRVDELALERLPYGERTRVSMSIRDMPVRRALADVLRPLALRMQVEDEAIRVLPAPVLQRLGRRLQLAEARLLEELAQHRWSDLAPPPAIEYRTGDDAARRRFEQALSGAAADCAIEQLDQAAEAAGWTWRPDGERIVVAGRREEIAQRLEMPLDLRYQRIPLDELLADLGHRVGVTMLFEPGALRAVDAPHRTVDLIQRRTTVRQTLERLCGNTGLRYEVVDEGVRILPPASAPTASRPGGRVAALIRMKLGPLELYLPVREDEVPPWFGQLRDEQIRRLREQLEPLRPAAHQEPHD